MNQAGVSAIPREVRAYQGRCAGLVTRSVTGVIDAAVLMLVLLGTYLGVNGLAFLAAPRDFEPLTLSPALDLALAATLATVYLGGLWATSGRTYGNQVMGLRVVGKDGARLRLLPSLVRAGLCVAFPLGLAWCAVSPTRSSVQDILLGTSVVYDWSGSSGPGAG